MKNIRIGVAQINPTVGDFLGNKNKIIEFINNAKSQMCDLVVFPELAVTGYHPEDLLFKSRFVETNKTVLREIVPETKDITVILGYVSGEGSKLFDSAAVIQNGKFLTHYDKAVLPSSGVFDEQRYFTSVTNSPLIRISDINLGISISEDIWDEMGPVYIQGEKGAEIFINISASPYNIGKYSERLALFRSFSEKYGVPFVYTNMVGGQDEMVFDGGSFVLNDKGEIIANCHEFKEELLVADIDIPEKEGYADIVITETFPVKNKKPVENSIIDKLEDTEAVYKALVMGTHDYVRKNGFDIVVVGLSGGIDSTLVATIAVDALGAEKVKGVAMPSRFSTDHAMTDAEDLVKNLGIEFYAMPIEDTYKAYLSSLSVMFKDKPVDSTEENIQARIRGNFLMALSNKFGWLVLTTGNKSETATGYTTLYGDMAGGFAVIKDVPKTQVYDVCKYRNSLPGVKPIPEHVLEKAPSAELRFNQKDSDSLPPYEVLDPILRLYVEQDLSVDEIVNMGYERDIVKRTARLVDLNEYKRRQGPPGIKITTRSFGRDRRLPITNRYRGV